MNKYMIALGILGLTATNIALAQNEKGPYAVNFDADSVTVSTSLGWLAASPKSMSMKPIQAEKSASSTGRSTIRPSLKAIYPGIRFSG
ncbi:hypothetical protein ACUW9M_005300 [Serratia sp. 121840015-2]